jgi:hypothetical protein
MLPSVIGSIGWSKRAGHDDDAGGPVMGAKPAGMAVQIAAPAGELAVAGARAVCVGCGRDSAIGLRNL